MATPIEYLTRAQTAFDAGFKSEAARKLALNELTRAFEYGVRKPIHAKLLAIPHHKRGEGWNELYYGAPDYPHAWTAKVADRYIDHPEARDFAAECVELRNAIKAATIAPRPPVEDHPLLTKVRKTFMDEMKARRANFDNIIDISRAIAGKRGEPLKGLPVSVRGHYCQNYGGTTWVRLDWYLRGERTAFSVIAAAYDQLVREGVIVEEDA